MKTLREQMSDAMVLRGFAPRTQESYLAAVRALAKYYRRSPDLLTPEEVEASHLHLIVERKLAYSSVNQSTCACRFLFGKVRRRPMRRCDIPMAKVPKTLPRVLSRDEVARLFEVTPNLRARTLLMLTYSTGLRVSEACALQFSDIESAPDRMCIKVVRARAARIATRCFPRYYWKPCASTGRCTARALGCFPTRPARGRSTSRWRSERMARRGTRRDGAARAVSTRCVIPSLPICWNPAWTSIPSNACSGTAMSRPPCATFTLRKTS